MDKKLLKEFIAWFTQFKKEHKKRWYAEKCEVIFFDTCNKFERLLKKTERDIDSKIDKEIRSKKQDRAMLMKAKRVSKGKNSEIKYIELRFDEEWDDASENILEPFLASSMKLIATAQMKHEEEEQEPGEEWRKDPRFKT